MTISFSFHSRFPIFLEDIILEASMLRINRSHERDSLHVVLHINFANYWKIVYLQLRVNLFVKVKLPTNSCTTSNKLKYELE